MNNDCEISLQPRTIVIRFIYNRRLSEINRIEYALNLYKFYIVEARRLAFEVAGRDYDFTESEPRRFAHSLLEIAYRTALAGKSYLTDCDKVVRYRLVLD